MRLNCSQTNLGIKINTKNKNFHLIYPDKIWKNFPSKDFLFDNLVYLLTISMPLVSNIKKVEYNTAVPYFKSEFYKGILAEIPSSADDYNVSARKIINKFKSLKIKFKDNKVKKPKKINIDLNERTTIPFSCGKDSLLTLAVAHELNLDPVLMYINDTVSPSENKIKIRYTKKISKKFHLTYYIVRNELEKLNDFEFWNKPETTLGYSHMIPSFVFISLPIIYKHKTKYLFLGNEQSLNVSFKTKEGFRVFPSPDQTPKGTIKLNKLIHHIMPKVHLGSLIEPLTNLATMKILHTRYKEFGKYQISCDCLDASSQPRWCQNNSMCADMYLYMKANNLDPRTVQLTKNMFNKRFLKHYALFSKAVDRYDKAPHARDQQLFAFYLAYRNGAKGYAIEKFKKKFLKEAQEREDQLHKKFFKIYPALTLTPKLRKAVYSIYKEELNA